MPNTTIRDLTSGSAIADGDLFISRQGADTVDKSVTGLQIKAYTGGGDVTGPSSSVDNAITRFDGTTGKIIQGYTSGAPTISDTGIAAFNNNVTVAGTEVITSASATSFVVGPNGTTNPGFVIDCSQASASTGFSFAAGAATRPTMTIIAAASSENGDLLAKNAGSLRIGSSGTGGSAGFVFGGSARLLMTQSTLTVAPTTTTTAAGARFLVTAAADTALTAGTESPFAYFNGSATRQHASNTAITLQRDFRISPTAHSFATAGGVITNASALAVDGPGSAGTNATITNSSGIYVPTTAVTGTVTNAYSLNIEAPTGGATINAAARVLGDIVMPGSSSGSVTVRTAAAAGTGTIFQLPADNGTNTYVLQTNGTGVTSWVAPSGGGGSPAFSAITSATNTTAAMVVGTGASIAATGSGTITATSCSGNAATATALASGRTLAITGDLAYTSPSFDGSGNVTAAGTLATVNANVGSFGSATTSPTYTVNGKGLITAAANATITPAVGNITGFGTGVSAALAVNIGTAGAPVVNGGALGTPSSGVATNLTGTAAGLTAGTVTTNANLTGDVTSSGNATTLATVNSNVGSFGSSTSIPSFTVNGKGLITAASGNAVVAPAGTLSGATLAAGVTASSLTSVGTLTSLTLGGTLAMSANNITMTGSLAATGARVTKGWFTDIESTNTPTVGGTALPTASSTTTFTNKRITKRVLTTNAPGATPTLNTDNYDVANFTGLSAAITSMTTNLSGTPTAFQPLIIAFTDDGTARGITWGASFESSTATLPTTTVISTLLTVGFFWNSVTSKWRCIAVA